MANHNKTTFHVAMFPWLAMGHLIPYLRFSNKLAARGHRVSFLVPNKTQFKLQPFNLFPHLISFVPLDVPHVHGLPHASETMSDVPYSLAPLLGVAFDNLKSQVELFLQTDRPRFIFYDFSYWLPPIARRLDVKSIAFMVVGPTINGFVAVDYSNKQATKEEDQLLLLLPPPGYPSPSFRLPSFQIQSALGILSQFGANGIKFYERLQATLSECDAITYKTCHEVEGPFCNYIESHFKKPVLLAGPVLPDPPIASDQLEDRWVKWLGGFEPGSVVYCSFGSECKLEKNQFQELVLGLEQTGLPFLVALKPPFGVEKVEEALPDGFQERVGGRGVVHGGWVQQQLILRHGSVGCFVSHCGYGSMWEALVSNCKIVMVPQIPDQFLNAKLMSEELKVGVEVERREEDGWYSKESVCKAVKLVMDEKSQLGKELKANHDKWKGILSREGFESSYIDRFLENLESL